ncbi:MAG: type II secretion system GspH family protein [Puniceicoccales bacterium]|jgi:prepilin-type N-terminal cleavage/methylation domain-containing protein|nr:type II secretion system GspH family protein [Puniceicoccales bacterium]
MNRQPARPARHQAFTLIEILAVIAIVAILSAAVLAIAPAVVEGQNRATTRGYIDSLASACEQFRNSNAFREYPTHEGEASDDEQWRLNFHACLTGLKVLHADNDKLRLASISEVTDTSGNPLQRRSFIAESAFKFNRVAGAIAEENQRYFVDSWENPIAYRYNVITGGEMGKAWLAPKYLIVSAGAKFQDPITPSDYFASGMQTSGQVPEDYADTYRADNIVSWSRD